MAAPQPRERGITRRQFLKSAGLATGGVGTVIVLDACGIRPSQPTTQPDHSIGTPTNPNVLATPSFPKPPEIPTNFASTYIDVAYLRQQGALVGVSYIDSNVGPRPTPVAERSTPQTEGIDQMIDYANKRWENRYDFDPSNNPLDALKFVVAQGPRQGTDAGVTYFSAGVNGENTAFAGLSLYREKMVMTNEYKILQGPEYTIKEGYPRGLVIREGSGITVVGRGNDGNIVISFEEYVPRDGGEFYEPRLRFAVVTPAELGNISQNFLPTLKYYPVDFPNTIRYSDQNAGVEREVSLNTIDDELMGMIRNETRDLWLDSYTDPNSATGRSLIPQPAIYFPPQELLQGTNPENLTYQQVENPNLIGNPGGVRFYAKDSSSNIIAVARYISESREWKWEALTFHEILDQKGITFGVEVDNSVSIDNDKSLITNDFNMVVPGYFSWGWIRRNGPNTNNIDFRYADEWVNFAIRNGMTVRNGNPLVYNVNLPDWLTKGNFSNDELRQVLKDHISAVVGHFKGRVSEWIVANEAYIYYQGYRGIQTKVNETGANFAFATQLGEEYIDLAFQTARDADPNATLIYNDFGIEYPGPKADWVFDRVRRLKEKGLIDAVGMQYHIGAPPTLYFQNINPNYLPTKDQLISQMRRYAEIGVKVIITELDVDLNSLPGNSEEKLKRQADIYQMVAEVCIESGNCNSITVWGLNDEGSWMNSVGGKSPLLFSNGQPKPAFNRLVDTLSK